jgi:hypothetical protein
LKKNQRLIFHGILFFFLTFALCAFQSVVWFQLFGHFVAPFFSFILFVYFGLDKDSWKSLIYCYAIVYIYSMFSYTSLGVLYFSSMITFLFLMIVKNRIYWPGPTYFTIMSASSLGLFHVSYIFTSLTFEAHTTPIMFFQRLAQIIMTSLISYFSYNIIKRIDTSFKIEPMAEIHGENHG